MIWCCKTFSGKVEIRRAVIGDFSMGMPLDTPDWRAMSQEDRDRGLNNSLAVAGSAAMAAAWEQRSAAMRERYPGHLDLRYGPRERNRIDFLKVADNAPTLVFIHGGYWQTRAKEVFTLLADGPMAHGINVALSATRWRRRRRWTRSSLKSTTVWTFSPDNYPRLAAIPNGSWCPAGPRADT